MDADQFRLMLTAAVAADKIRFQAETIEDQNVRLKLAQHKIFDLSALVKKYESALYDLGAQDLIEK